MGKHIGYSKDEINRANQTDIESILRNRGCTLRKSGKEMSWEEPGKYKVSIRGNEWYSQYEHIGGGAILFLEKYFGCDFLQAMKELHEGEKQTSVADPTTREVKVVKERERLQLPPKADSNERIISYLTKTRLLAAEVVDHFIGTGQLYESAEPYQDKHIHNLVIVGTDRKGVPKQAHIKGISYGSHFRRNAIGSDVAYGFSHLGTTDTIHVFEAAIDMLSDITLHPSNWQADSYVALNGVSDQALSFLLDRNPRLKQVVLSLDHDPGGQMASLRLEQVLLRQGYAVTTEIPKAEKDWNEQLRHLAGLPFVCANEQPQLENLEEQASVLYKQFQSGSNWQMIPKERLTVSLEKAIWSYQENPLVAEKAMRQCARSAVAIAAETLRHCDIALTERCAVVGICLAADRMDIAQPDTTTLDAILGDTKRMLKNDSATAAKTKSQLIQFAEDCLVLAGRCAAVYNSIQPNLTQQEESNCQMKL